VGGASKNHACWQGVEKTSCHINPAHPGSWSGAGAGVRKTPKNLDSGFRRNDEKSGCGTFSTAGQKIDHSIKVSSTLSNSFENFFDMATPLGYFSETSFRRDGHEQF